MCIDDILLASSDVNLSLEKEFLSSSFKWMISVKRHPFYELELTKIEEKGY
jgi:hypothetical protein